MTPADQYRIRAAEFRTRARGEARARLAAEWEHLAECYVRLAEQADRNQHVDVSYEPSPPIIPKEAKED